MGIVVFFGGALLGPKKLISLRGVTSNYRSGGQDFIWGGRVIFFGGEQGGNYFSIAPEIGP